MKIFSQTGFSAIEHQYQGRYCTSSKSQKLSSNTKLKLLGLLLLFTFSVSVLAVESGKQTLKNAREKVDSAEQTKPQWLAVVGKNPINGLSECHLYSATQTIFDGVSKIRINFMFSRKHLFIITNGNIDTSYKNTGVAINTSERTRTFSFNNINNKTNLVLANFTIRHIMHVINAKSISVTLGFWPSWPKTKTHTVNVKLDGFTDAYRKFLKCKVTR